MVQFRWPSTRRCPAAGAHFKAPAEPSGGWSLAAARGRAEDARGAIGRHGEDAKARLTDFLGSSFDVLQGKPPRAPQPCKKVVAPAGLALDALWPGRPLRTVPIDLSSSGALSSAIHQSQDPFGDEIPVHMQQLDPAYGASDADDAFSEQVDLVRSHGKKVCKT